MSVKIKLTRLGSKKHPFYRVVAANDCTARDGRPLEFLGFYNPMTNPAQVQLDAEKSTSGLPAAPSRPTQSAPCCVHTSASKQSGMPEELQDVLAGIARSLVDQPDRVSVTASQSASGIVYTVTVPAEERGKLIGRQGRTVRALRSWVHAASLKRGTHMTLEIS